MKFKSLNIKNFKSIVDLTINEPNPFTVFVGPNGSGKSNIFEALEFYLKYSENKNAISLFGGEETISNKNLLKSTRYFYFLTDDWDLEIDSFEDKKLSKLAEIAFNKIPKKEQIKYSIDLESLPENNILKQKIKISNLYQNQFSRIFTSTKKENRQNFTDDKKLNFNTNNLEKVLRRILFDKEKKEEISEWLDLFIPEFDRIEVQKSAFSSNENLLIHQKNYKAPFNKELISDGTYNIIALLTAVYQSDEPQFLCIEEPENGLHPFVQKELVNFFRWACEEHGHYIWLNTHSQTIVSQLKKEEIITVRKEKGETQILQHTETELYDLPIDEAWLNQFLEGGVKWG